MDKAIKDKWTAALRSGEYKQGSGYLHSIKNNTFCCLGVLCEVTDVLNKIDEEFSSVGYTYTFEVYDVRHSSCVPRGFHGLDVSTLNKLINMNDRDHPLSFNEIADWIDANVPTT